MKELERDPEVVGRIMPANLYQRIRTLRDQGLIEESDERLGHDAIRARIAG